jgi:hypothetical protein
MLGVGPRPFACWDGVFKSHRGQGCPSLVSVVWCKIVISVTGRSDPFRGVLPRVVCLNMIEEPVTGGLGPLGAVEP